jgi:hypothetical protein
MNNTAAQNNAAERLALVVARLGSGVGMARAELGRAAQRLDDVQQTLDQLHGIIAKNNAPRTYADD